MNRIQLTTIGYSSAFPNDVLAECKVKGIKTIVDIRSIPYGRRKQWNRDELEKTCESFEINYVYRGKSLGFPREFWSVADWRGKYCELVEKDIEKIVADLKSQEQPIALLCVEKDYEECHRSVLAKAIQKFDPEIECVDFVCNVVKKPKNDQKMDSFF